MILTDDDRLRLLAFFMEMFHEDTEQDMDFSQNIPVEFILPSGLSIVFESRDIILVKLKEAIDAGAVLKTPLGREILGYLAPIKKWDQ